MATLGVLSVDQTIMLLYGVHLGAAVIQYFLSMHLEGRSRQVSMLQVGVNVLICLVTVPALFVEVYFGVPLMKALVLSIDQGLAQQMGIVLLIVNLLGAVVLLGLLGTGGAGSPEVLAADDHGRARKAALPRGRGARRCRDCAFARRSRAAARAGEPAPLLRDRPERRPSWRRSATGSRRCLPRSRGFRPIRRHATPSAGRTNTTRC